MLTTIKTLIFNLKEKLFHTKHPEEVQLIKNTHLFDEFSSDEFENLLSAIRLVKYPAGKVFVKKGERANALYVVVEGGLRVFSYDLNGAKIPLSRLNKGAYFGEQVLVGNKNKIRNANIETISDTLLIEVDEKAIRHMVMLDAIFRNFPTYENLQKAISKIKNPRIIYFEDKQTIFNIGDKADFMYIIVSGDVALFLQDPITGIMNKSILHVRNIFGELGVIENKPRAGTAIAIGKVQLLALDKDELDQYFQIGNKAHSVLLALKKSYTIPKTGTTEQFFGHDKEMGTTLTTLYYLKDGRKIISERSLVEDLFSMSLENAPPGKWLEFREGNEYIKINVGDQHLIGICARGVWDQLPKLCRWLLENDPIGASFLDKFEKYGEIEVLKQSSVANENEIVCDCYSVSKKQIQELIDQGLCTITDISIKTGACSACGACKCKVLEMLGVRTRMAAIMTKQIAHNHYISSYTIKLSSGDFGEFHVGQHVVLQVEINNNLIERPYTISWMAPAKNELQVTIKKEPKGYFSQWLFEQAPTQFILNVTQPQGSFIFDANTSSDAVCFAGGIGITPFIAFGRELELKKNSKNVHLVYTALTQDDFIFVDDFKKMSEALANFKVTYKATNVEGFLTKEEIKKFVNELNSPDVYICGPKPFLELIDSTLRENGYDKKKIHIEQFVHAGGK